MKKSLLTALAAVAVVALPAAAGFTSTGTGTVYTFAQLAQNDTSGVTLVNGAYQVAEDLTIAAGDTLRLENNDTVKLATEVRVTVEGVADFAPADTAYVTHLVDGGYARFHVTGSINLKNVTTDYVSYNFASQEGRLTAENCSFRYFVYKSTTKTGSSAFSVGYSTQDNYFKNCYFIESQMAALGSPSNGPAKVTVEQCVFYRNDTNNRNYPQVNLTCYGDAAVVVKDCYIVGGQFSMSGGIAVSNMMGQSPYGNAVIENNYIADNRYGCTTLGPVYVRYLNNEIVDNKYETNPNNGGSGIAITSNYASTYMEGNTIEGNLWGVTLVGTYTDNVNMGKTDDPQAEDYNPGNNTFANNGNNDVLYDLYNNTPNTVYAQGNTWGVANQTKDEIESVIFHQNDDETLGKVVFWSYPTAINDVTVEKSSKATKYIENGQLVIEKDGVKYNVAGQAIK